MSSMNISLDKNVVCTYIKYYSEHEKYFIYHIDEWLEISLNSIQNFNETNQIHNFPKKGKLIRRLCATHPMYLFYF